MKQKLFVGIARLAGFVLLFVVSGALQRAAEQQAQTTYEYWPTVLTPVLLAFLWAVYLRTVGAPEFWQWVGQKEKRKLSFSVESCITAAAVLFLFLILSYKNLLASTGAYSNLLAYLLIWYFLLGSIHFDLKDKV